MPVESACPNQDPRPKSPGRSWEPKLLANRCAVEGIKTRPAIRRSARWRATWLLALAAAPPPAAAVSPVEREVLPVDITFVSFGNPIWTRPNDLG